MGMSAVGAFQKYINGLGGPRSDPDEPEFAVRIPTPPDAADDVVRHLVNFVGAVASSTNARFNGWMSIAGASGCRDGAFAVPGHGGPRGDAALMRPPLVEKLVQLGGSAMSEARAISDLYRAKFELEQSVAMTSADANLGQRRRRLHQYQLGLLAGLSVLLATAFGAIAARLNDWPQSSTKLSGEAGGAATTTSGYYLVATTLMIVAFGITAGFFRAIRERTLAAGVRSDERQYVERGADLADTDPLVSKVWKIGLALSMAIALLLGVGGFFKLDDVSIGRMALGVFFWLVWGATTYLSCGLMAQLSQHWLNLLPAEIDLTDSDKASAKQNAASAGVGRKYIDDVLGSQHDYVVEVSLAFIEHYYESNLVMRNSSRDADLDRFVGEDIAKARRDMQELANGLRPKSTPSVPG